MPDDDQPASNVVPFPGKPARVGPAAALDTDSAATALTSAARSLERALRRQHAAVRDWCTTIEDLARTADTLADNLRALHEHGPLTTPADQGKAGEP